MSWIGVDLDGTLAEYHGWQGADHIGDPVPAMVERVKQWLINGKDVRIFTARIADGNPFVRDLIEQWCIQHVGQALPITATKDYGMVELWDDRAVQVIANTGESLADVVHAAASQIRDRCTTDMPLVYGIAMGRLTSSKHLAEHIVQVVGAHRGNG